MSKFDIILLLHGNAIIVDFKSCLAWNQSVERSFGRQKKSLYFLIFLLFLALVPRLPTSLPLPLIVPLIVPLPVAVGTVTVGTLVTEEMDCAGRAGSSCNQ